MAITFVDTGCTFTSQLELDLYAGSPEGGNLWQGTDYPGALTAMQAQNADRLNVSGMKLVVGSLVVPAANAATISLQATGEGTQILGVMIGGMTTAAESVSTALSATATAALAADKQVNDTVTLTYSAAGATPEAHNIWMIVA